MCMCVVLMVCLLNKVESEEDKSKETERSQICFHDEVDHLEDGYKWRKYGQKAVKNSPFPMYIFDL